MTLDGMDGNTAQENPAAAAPVIDGGKGLVTQKTNLDYVPVLAPDGHEAGRIYYRPFDVNLFLRYTRNQNRLLRAIKPLERCNINPDGTGKDLHSIRAIKKAENILCGLIDEICGTKTAADAFKEIRPFAEVPHGELWATTVFGSFNVIIQNISSNVTKRTMKKLPERGRKL